MTIRQIRQDDDRTVAAIFRGVFEEFGLPKVHTIYDDPSTDRQYEVFSDEPRSVLWVAEDDGGQVVGCCGVYPTGGLPDGWCELVKFYVSPAARGSGIGTRLFELALRSAAELGYETVYLETFSQLHVAVGMYRRFGFQSLEHQVGNSGHTATGIWMKKELGAERR